MTGPGSRRGRPRDHGRGQNDITTGSRQAHANIAAGRTGRGAAFPSRRNAAPPGEQGAKLLRHTPPTRREKVVVLLSRRGAWESKEERQGKTKEPPPLCHRCAASQHQTPCCAINANSVVEPRSHRGAAGRIDMAVAGWGLSPTPWLGHRRSRSHD